MNANKLTESTFDISGGLGVAWKWKMSSEGNFAKDLQNWAKTHPEYVSDLYPALGNSNKKYVIEAPCFIYHMLKGNYLETALYDATSHMTGNYPVKDAFKVEQQEIDKAELKFSLPLAQFLLIDVKLDCGLSLDVSYYPTVSYYSVADKRFFPVVIRSNKSLATMVKNATSYVSSWFDKAFSNNDKEEINDTYIRMNDVYGRGAVAGFNQTFTIEGLEHDYTKDTDAYYVQSIKRRQPRLFEKKQTDICTFTFTLNDGVENFKDGTNLEFSHFYPAGDLLGITNKGDTLFVVSEVCQLSANDGSQSLKTTQKGNFKLGSYIGADDLTPFGFSDNQALDVYYSEAGSKDTWYYVGPAGKNLEVNKMGKYMMATSIKNDVIAPEIIADLDEKTGLLHIKVNENIGLRVNTLEVLVNGELREINMINESNFELQLNPEDLDYMLVIDINVYDLAGNKGNLVLIYNIDKPEMDDIEEHQMDSNATINLAGRTLTVDGATPGAFVTVYSIDGVIQKKAATDADGHATIDLNSVLEGVYIVTLSDGKAKKFYVK